MKEEDEKEKKRAHVVDASHTKSPVNRIVIDKYANSNNNNKKTGIIPSYIRISIFYVSKHRTEVAAERCHLVHNIVFIVFRMKSLLHLNMKCLGQRQANVDADSIFARLLLLTIEDVRATHSHKTAKTADSCQSHSM